MNRPRMNSAEHLSARTTADVGEKESHHAGKEGLRGCDASSASGVDSGEQRTVHLPDQA